MERSELQTFKRWQSIDIALLLLWLVALVSYFAPWIVRKPISAALAWNAYDLFDVLRFLPEIETGAVTVNLQALRLPLVGLAALLPLLVAPAGRWVRLLGALFGCALALLTLPPYPEILTAWRTPGWRVPFWWALGAAAFTIASVWLAPRFRRERLWAILGIVELVTIPAIVTLRRLLPALSRLHAAPVHPGWGFWACVSSFGLLGVATWFRTSFFEICQVGQPPDSSVDIATAVTSSAYRQPARREGVQMGENTEYSDTPSPTPLSRIREVKAKYEAHLMSKPNVVAVGIGVPMKEGSPAGSPGIIVSVTHKVAEQELRQEDLVPEQLEDVPVWVEEIGQPSSASSSEPEPA